jgi:hypothetical protein
MEFRDFLEDFADAQAAREALAEIEGRGRAGPGRASLGRTRSRLMTQRYALDLPVTRQANDLWAHW